MGALVVESFERLEILLEYLKYFPPPTQWNKMPRTEVHTTHKKKLSHRHEREAYFNMLLEVVFEEKLERNQEKDYLALTHSAFKTCCVRLEEQDKKDRNVKQKARQAAKRDSEKSQKESSDSPRRSQVVPIVQSEWKTQAGLQNAHYRQVSLPFEDG